MRSLFLAPHNDDETLFGAFTILRHKPHVIVCFKSVKQPVEASVRETETARALWWLGDPTWEQWQVSDFDPDWREIDKRLHRLATATPLIEVVYAPAIEEDGHDQHSEIGERAIAFFGARNVIHYTTYRRGYGRTMTSTPVAFEPAWVGKKLRAMSCYESQFSDELGTMPWFVDEGLREFYA